MYDGSSYRESTVLHKSGKGWSRESVRPEGCVTREEGTNLCGSRARKDTYWQRLHNTSIIGFLDPLKKKNLGCPSLRSKRFRGVQGHRITAWKKERGGGLKPLFLILALAPISRGQNTVPVPFLGLSLLPNPRKRLLCRLWLPRKV